MKGFKLFLTVCLLSIGVNGDCHAKTAITHLEKGINDSYSVKVQIDMTQKWTVGEDVQFYTYTYNYPP